MQISRLFIVKFDQCANRANYCRGQKTLCITMWIMTRLIKGVCKQQSFRKFRRDSVAPINIDPSEQKKVFRILLTSIYKTDDKSWNGVFCSWLFSCKKIDFIKGITYGYGDDKNTFITADHWKMIVSFIFEKWTPSGFYIGCFILLPLFCIDSQ